MAFVNNRMNADTLSIDVLHTYILFYYKYCTNTFPRFLSSLLHLLYRSLKGVGDKWEAKDICVRLQSRKENTQHFVLRDQKKFIHWLWIHHFDKHMVRKVRG